MNELNSNFYFVLLNVKKHLNEVNRRAKTIIISKLIENKIFCKTKNSDFGFVGGYFIFVGRYTPHGGMLNGGYWVVFVAHP